MAFEAEIDLTYMGGIERGRRNPSLLVMARIAEALGGAVAEIANGLRPSPGNSGQLQKGMHRCHEYRFRGRGLFGCKLAKARHGDSDRALGRDGRVLR